MSAITKAKPNKRRLAATDPEGVMGQLRAAADKASPHDVSPFVTVFRHIDWSTRSADDHVEGIQLALWVGAHPLARELAITGSNRYANHPKLQKMAHVLAPPKVTVRQTGFHPDLKANSQWLKTNWDSYRGHWVALRDGQLLATGDSLAEIVDQVGEINNTDILVTPLW